ncbi:MAG: galactofuranose transport system permease protein [Thermoleophilaceae bacterium]|jgi:ribose transport system permease protein|nr:galactofuranose transport system permease protein [Acidobacteriota bacterium]MEA2484436.1 galactofuranose transport system permease protein [Thermoleophilaceae bacterium]
MSQAATTIDESGSTRGRVARAKLASFIQRQGALVALVLVCIFASVRYGTFLDGGSFLTSENLLNVIAQNSMVGLIALGMTFVILTGGIDLSVGSLLAVGGVVSAVMAGNNFVIVLLAAVGATTLLGLINGLVIAKVRIQPFIVTLAMMIAARGVALLVAHEKPIEIKNMSGGFKALWQGQVGPIPLPIIILILAYIIGWIVLNHTRFGRHAFALGDNQEAARLMGLNVNRVTLGVYALSGALAGLAGVILASRLGSGQPVAGTGFELDAIAAVVVGGTLLTGGQGGVGSTLVGVLLLGVLFNILNNEGDWIGSYWQGVLRGIFLLAVVIIQNRLSARKR